MSRRGLNMEDKIEQVGGRITLAVAPLPRLTWTVGREFKYDGTLRRVVSRDAAQTAFDAGAIVSLLCPPGHIWILGGEFFSMERLNDFAEQLNAGETHRWCYVETIVGPGGES